MLYVAVNFVRKGEIAWMETNITMTVKETAQYLGVSKELIYKMIKVGNFVPVLRVGRSIRIQKTKLEEWIEEQTEMEAKRVKGESL